MEGALTVAECEAGLAAALAWQLKSGSTTPPLPIPFLNLLRRRDSLKGERSKMV